MLERTLSTLWLCTFVGFKLCTLALQRIGYRGASLSDLTPTVGSNVLLLLIYAFFGIGFPLLFMWGFRNGKRILLKIMHNEKS